MTLLEVQILKWAPQPLRRFYETYVDICRFIIIGGLATLVHYVAALTAYGVFNVPPLWANFIAFIIAFNVTYLGHYFWVFKSENSHRSSLPKSLSVSLTGLMLSQLIVWGLTEKLDFPFHFTLIAAVTLVPIVTFSLNRFWVFKAER